MKKTITILAAVLLTASVLLPQQVDSQTPQSFSYQAITRDAQGNPLTMNDVNFQISILQGSASGTTVYSETHQTTTNEFGLVNLEVGNGTIVSGDFTTINWGDDSFFLKTEMDETGGTNYQVLGTSQLSSVPYALYAKEANIDGSETIVTAGLNVIVNGTGTIPDPYVIHSAGGHYPGELFGGGVVFWVNHNRQHGLICSMVDLDTAQVWSNVDDALIGNAAQSHWNGFGNSMAIVNQQGHVTSAAKLCLDYTNAGYGTGTFDDWYLLAIAEFKHLGNSIYEVQKALDIDGDPATTPVTTNVYWSSSEYSGSSAWGCDISAMEMLLKSEPLFVRAVRAF